MGEDQTFMTMDEFIRNSKYQIKTNFLEYDGVLAVQDAKQRSSTNNIRELKQRGRERQRERCKTMD